MLTARQALVLCSIGMTSWVGCVADDGAPGGHAPLHLGSSRGAESDAGRTDANIAQDAAGADAAPSTVELSVTSPAHGAVLKGKVTVSGTAGADVAGIEVTLAGMPMASIAGTHAWEVLVDTTRVANGPQALEVVATTHRGEATRVVVPVSVDNLAPIVGRWRFVPAQSFNGKPCEVWFFPSGAFYEPCNGLATGQSSWTMQTPDLILLGGSDGTSSNYLGQLLVRIVSFSDGGNTVKLQSVNNNAYWGTLKLTLVEHLDPFDPSYADAGVN